MINLHVKIKQASKCFKQHNYKKALEAYDSIIQQYQEYQQQQSEKQPKRKEYEKQQSDTFLLNLYSSKAAILTIINRLEQAQKIIEIGLNKDPYHLTLLVRRSQILKKQNKIKEAINDLQTVLMFSPDNMQLVAMKMELDNIMLRKGQKIYEQKQNKGQQVTSFNNNYQECQQQDIDLDQQAALNFSGLKIIDRPSIRLHSNQDKQHSPFKVFAGKRESHVTISGDSAFFYEKDDQQEDKSSISQKSNNSFSNPIQKTNSLNLSIEAAMQKYDQIEKQLAETDGQDLKAITPIIKCNSPQRGKSILKNRNSHIYVDNNKNVYAKSQRRSSFIQRLKQLKDIDGKIIKPEQTGKGLAGVGFRKSISFSPNPNISSSFSGNNTQGSKLSSFCPSPVGKKSTSTSSRKSCLKRSSFECPQLSSLSQNSSLNLNPSSNNEKPVRRSKFDMLSKMSIDGGLVKHSKDEVKQDRQNQSNSDDDQGSSHNIFGSQQQFILSKEIRQNFGLDQQSSKNLKEKKLKKDGSKSILRKESVFVGSGSKKNKHIQSIASEISPQKKFNRFKDEEDQIGNANNIQQKQKKKLKSKKSVMFKG